MEIKIEGIVQEVRDGQVTKVKIEDQIFVPEKNKTITYQAKIDIKPYEKFTPAPKKKAYFKGVKIAEMRNNAVYQNVLDDVREGLNAGVSNEQLRQSVKQYYPDSCKSSIYTYVSVYKRFLKNEQVSIKPIVKRRRHRRKPADCHGFSKTYRTWVRNVDFDKVKLAINNITKWGYKPHVIAISKETGLKQQRVRATVKYMLDNKIIISRVDDGKLLYQLV